MSSLESAGPDASDAGAPSDAGASSDATATPAIAAVFRRTVLLTDQTNPDLVNAWGLAFNQTAGPAWIANAGTGTSSVLDGRNKLLLTVTVPAPEGVDKAAPTGIVFNANKDAFKGDAFVFVTEDGTVAGWQQGIGASLRVDNSASQAIYKGATIADVKGKPRLYATNFHAGRVDVYDQDYAVVPQANGAFTDPSVPSGFAPFNADAVGNLILVTYAKQDEDAHDDVKGAGNGFLDAFDTEGNLVARLASSGTLNSPWGLAVTPDDFGPIPHRLLVGNFGDGLINVFDVDLSQSGLRADFEGQIGDRRGVPLAIEGLWSLRFPGGPGFDPSQLYFTAGPGDEEHGEYGRLDLVLPTATDP
jgi:uncharacterized protein (TIGR03118 family)